jgi:ABC-type glycerol-3-phosphate transport system permease component
MVCFLFMLIMVFPIYWMVSTSLVTNSELMQTTPAFYPSKLSFENYGRMIRHTAFRQYISNTLVMAGFILLGEVTIGTLAAYGFSKGRFKGKNALFIVVLGSITIPTQALYVPLYTMASKLNWINTFPGLILPNLVSGFFIFLVRQAFLSVDESYLDAAKLDGMGRIRTIAHVLIPLSRPAFIAACFVTLVNGWNSYIWPKLITTNEKRRTIAVGIQSLRRTYSGTEAINYNEIMAGAVLAMLPIFFLFVVFHRYLTINIKEPPIK